MVGDTLHVFTALGFEQEGTDAILSYRNNHGILSFPSGEDTTAIFTGILPCQFRQPIDEAGTTIAAYLHYTADDDSVTGNFLWSIAIERIGDNYQNIDADSFATESTVVTAAPTTSGDVFVCNMASVNRDGAVVGDMFRLRVKRLGTNELDTATVTAQFLAIELREV